MIEPLPLIQGEADIETERAEEAEVAETAADRFEPFCGEIGELLKGDGAEIGERDDADRFGQLDPDFSGRLDRGAPPERLIVGVQRADRFVAVAAQLVFRAAEKQLGHGDVFSIRSRDRSELHPKGQNTICRP